VTSKLSLGGSQVDSLLDGTTHDLVSVFGHELVSRENSVETEHAEAIGGEDASVLCASRATSTELGD
jgi:hypothetical protein